MATQTYTRMGAYLTVLDKSDYLPSEPPESIFPIISSVGKFTKGEVGVPITFNANDLTDIQKRLGLPVASNNDANSNNKEWWAFYRAFQHSKPNVVFRVIADSFRNPAVLMTVNSAANETVPYTTVDGQTVNFTTPSRIDETEDTNKLIENSEIASIKMENITLGANDLGIAIYKYAGKNTSNITGVVLNKKALTETIIIPHVQYQAVLSATIASLESDNGIGQLTITNAGSGYSSGLLSFIVYQSNGTTPSTGSGLQLSYTFGTDGSVTGITVVNGGQGYASNDVIKFFVDEGDKVYLKYPQYSFATNLYDFELTDGDNILLVYEDDVLVEKFIFNGDNSSDNYWENINSDYGYFKFNNDMLSDTAYTTEAYAASFSFVNKGVGVFSDITFADYLKTVDYMIDNSLENSMISDGAIPVLFSEAQVKEFQKKLISTVAPKIYGDISLSFPKSIEDTFIGKYNITESDLNVYVEYKNSLGYNSSEQGYDAEMVAPSLQKVFDVFNNKWIWIPVSTDIAGGYTRLGNNYQYSPVETRRGTFGFDSLIWKNKKDDLEAYLYKNGINPIVFKNQTYVLKGHKTLTTKNTAFNRMNVSRTINVFKVQARELGTQFVGELALSETRLSAIDVFNRFVTAWVNDGKIVEGRVIVGNDPVDIDNNILRITLLIKPVKLFDFVPITIQVTSQGAKIV